ncbi:hypothetical protein KGY73_09945 [bacterium]|nr:hypothetical protein [bacterium]
MKKFKSMKNSQRNNSFTLNKEDINLDLSRKRGSSLFLGKYSIQEVEAVLKKRNFLKEAQKRGLLPLKSHLNSSEFPLQRFQLFHKKKKPKNLIVDLKIKEGKLNLDPKRPWLASFSQFRYLILEWLTLQNPLQDFSSNQIPLPGQEHPGLSLGKKVMNLFVYLARLNRNDGILAYPAYFHNALLFSRYFYFFNPEKQGEILAIRKTFSDVPFRKLAWIIHLKCLREKDKNVYEWNAEEQVYPLNKDLKNYFDSKEYKKKAKQKREEERYSIDWDCYEKKIKNEPKIKQ